jgi:hypothetical protein
VPNSFKENVCENANTLAHVVDHMVGCHICEGGEVCAVEKGLGSSLPPAELARRDSTLFGEVKCLFSSMPKVREETEANGGHSGDRMLHRTRSQFDRTRPVSSLQQSGARVLGFATGASGHSRDRRVRSGAQRSSTCHRTDRTRGASGHT